MEFTNKITIVKNQQELINLLNGERQIVVDFQREMSRDILEKKVSAIKEKRVFFQNVALASATILGLTSVFSSISGSAIVVSYLGYGIALHLAVISVVFLYMREVLDEDLEGLTKTLDKYGQILSEKKILIESSLMNVLTSEHINVDQALSEYMAGIEKLPSIDGVKKDMEEFEEQRRSRKSGKDIMEFYGEVINFLFISASLFILMAIIFKQPIPISWIWGGLLGVFILTFTSILTKLFKLLFRMFTYVRRFFIKLEK